MSTPIDDGGPAFPVQTFYNPNSGEPCNTGQYWDGNGMALRDWFAGQALDGLIQSAQYGAELHRIFDANDAIVGAGDHQESPQVYTARIAYPLADAMLAARKATA